MYKRIENRESNLWERTPESPDFLDIRIGTGERPFLVELKVPEQKGYEEDPLVTEAQNVKRISIRYRMAIFQFL